MNSQKLPIGILGDGQLALMLGEAALAQGIAFLAYGNDVNSSFCTRFPEQFVLGERDDEAALSRFAQACSVLTLENEFYQVESLKKVSAVTGTPVIPDSASYRHFESKISQHLFYDQFKIPTPRWEPLMDNKIAMPYPFVLKASAGGYDGYGVRMVESEQACSRALNELGFFQGRPLLVEEKVSLMKEFAQGALLDGKGGIKMLPLVETVQKNGICEQVLSRPNFNQSFTPEIYEGVKNQIQAIFTKLAGSGLKGLFNFEFFVAPSGEVLMNEGAPRPHNSQHLSLNASAESQFSILMSYLWTQQLDSKPIEALPGVMINLLGKSQGEHYTLKLPSLPEGLEVYPKLYLKKECRPGRKMGHLNLIDRSQTLNLSEIAEQILKEYDL